MSTAANSPLVSRYMAHTFPSPYTLSAAHTWISLNAGPSPTHFVICLSSAPSTVIGAVGLVPGQGMYAHTADLGYWLGEGYWGQGIMREALEGFLGWAFEEGRWERLTANCLAGNGGSWAVLVKAGFVVEGRQRGQVVKGGVVDDQIIFGLGRVEWVTRKQKGEGMS
jgi:[ribosomal protein S5]-alanine N-acetyltransferase